MNLTATTGVEYEYSGGNQQAIYRAMQDCGIRCQSPSSWHRTREVDYWDLKTDATCGWEIASPVLHTFEHVVDAANVSTIIRNCGGRVNDRCGFHVHVGMMGMTEEQLENIFRFLTRYEQAFFLIIPPSRRGNTYCKRLPSETYNRIKSHRFQNDQWWLSAWPDKNVWSNGHRYPDIRTIEFRLMPGTLDVNFIIGYITFLQCVLNVVKDKTINWGLAKSRDERSLFQTMLGQAGFYGPWITPDQKTLCITGRKWAIERYTIANDVREMTAQAMRSSSFDDCIPTYRVSGLTPNIPTVDLRPTWERVAAGELRPTPNAGRRVRPPYHRRPSTHASPSGFVSVDEVAEPIRPPDPPPSPPGPVDPMVDEAIRVANPAGVGILESMRRAAGQPDPVSQPWIMLPASGTTTPSTVIVTTTVSRTTMPTFTTWEVTPSSTTVPTQVDPGTDIDWTNG